MKQNQNNSFNRSNRFNRDVFPEKFSVCSCGAKAKLRSKVNYPFGQKSKAVKSQYYKCDECGKIRFIIEKQKGGRK